MIPSGKVSASAPRACGQPAVAASYSVAADQRVAGVPEGYTEVEFTVTQEACAAVTAGGPNSDGDVAQDQAALANTGGGPLGGLLGAGGLLLAAGAALFLARRRLLAGK